MGHLLYDSPRFIAAVWHTQRMANSLQFFSGDLSLQSGIGLKEHFIKIHVCC